MDVMVGKPSLFFLLMVLSLALSLLQYSSAQNSPKNGITASATGVGYPSPSTPPNEKPRFSPFRPSVAVIVGVLTTMFSVTFLLLLYAKHCKRGGSLVGGSGDHRLNSSSYAASAGRKNSGIDRAVVESLPVFRFGSLSGHHKDGLECAVCLNRFESSDVLRLLPKCKHAFHVECVDTWLDAHSTCPLCRYRVDPEDILLVESQAPPPPPPGEDAVPDIESGIKCASDGSEPNNNNNAARFFGWLSGRHSSAGERVFQIVDPASYRRSLDSFSSRKKKDMSVAVGCFDRSSRKDGLLLSRDRNTAVMSSDRGRFEHRIIVSPARGAPQYQRWSDVQPSDLLYLRSEMIMSDSRRFSAASGSLPAAARQQQAVQSAQAALHFGCNDGKGQEHGIDGDANRIEGSGRRVINSRSVSEITGLSRFSNDNNPANNDTHQHQRQRQRVGLLSRWVVWVSQLRPAVGSASEGNNHPHVISP